MVTNSFLFIVDTDTFTTIGPIEFEEVDASDKETMMCISESIAGAYWSVE